MNRARVLIADDHPMTLEGIRSFLEPHLECVATVSDGRALLEVAPHFKPDLIILDITMPLLNGIDAARQVRKLLPDARFIFVTMHVNPAYLEAALHAGATGYVVKSAAREELLRAIAVVMSGRVFVSPTLSGDNMERFKEPSSAAASLHLSVREREILQLIAEGKASKEMAYILSISAKTVAFHRDNIKKKLGKRTTAELTKYAIEQGLV